MLTGLIGKHTRFKQNKQNRKGTIRDKAEKKERIGTGIIEVPYRYPKDTLETPCRHPRERIIVINVP